MSDVKTGAGVKDRGDGTGASFDEGFGGDDDSGVDFGDDPTTVRHGVAKAGAILPVLKSGIMRTMTEGIERMMSLADVVRGATVTTEKADRPLPAAIGRELQSIEGILATVTKIGDCPGGLVKDPQSGKCVPPKDVSKAQHADAQDCPDGMRFDPAQGKCVPGMAKQEIPAPVKAQALKALTSWIEKAMSLRNEIRDAVETEKQMARPLPAEFGLAIRGLATSAGSLLSRFPSPAAKAFVIVDAESDPTDLAKAANDLSLTSDQQTDLAARLEKGIDSLSETMIALDRTAEHSEAAAEAPAFVSTGTDVAIDGLRKMSTEFVEKIGDCPGNQIKDPNTGKCVEPAVQKASATDAGADGTDTAGAAAATTGAGDAGASDAGVAAGAGGMVPVSAGSTSDDIAAMVAKGLTEAMKPFMGKIDQIETEVKHQGEVVQKMATTVPAPLAEEPGQTAVRKGAGAAAGGDASTEHFGEGWASDEMADPFDDLDDDDSNPDQFDFGK